MDMDKLKAQLFSLLSLYNDGSPQAASNFLEGWPDDDSFLADLTSHLAGHSEDEIGQHIVASYDPTARFAAQSFPCAPLHMHRHRN
jgi:hypothetical protein